MIYIIEFPGNEFTGCVEPIIRSQIHIPNERMDMIDERSRKSFLVATIVMF